MNRRTATVLIAVASFALLASSCEDDATRSDRETSEQILVDLQNAHPVPKFQRSQLRQNLVELTTAQAETTATTTLFFNLGVVEPVMTCPSIGFPIPATMQLTNPEMKVGGTDAVIAQVEPTGVFTGETTGTYAICVDARGDAFSVYWEGFTMAITGPAEFVDGETRLVGPPSFEFSTEEDDG